MFSNCLPLTESIAKNMQSKLPVYDFSTKKKNLKIKYGHLRPLPAQPSDILSFSAWELAHAVRKAELTLNLNDNIVNCMSIGFLLENGYMFEWDSQNFRLSENAMSLLIDFSSSSLRGRISQGISHLYMAKLGYSFIGHFNTIYKNKISNKKAKTPDFVFEKNNSIRALVESKGSFVHENEIAKIKGQFSDALKQLTPWGKEIDPSIRNKFAIGTNIREKGDNNKEPSLIAFIDPENNTENRNIVIPPYVIRRANYVSWLKGMGYNRASSLLSGKSEREHTIFNFFISNILNHDYAITPIAIMHLDRKEKIIQGDNVLELLKNPMGFVYPLSFFTEAIIVLAGIDYSILQKVANASENNNGAGLMEINTLTKEIMGDLIELGIIGSQFPDGSFFGAITIQNWLKLEKKLKELKF